MPPICFRISAPTADADPDAAPARGRKIGLAVAAILTVCCAGCTEPTGPRTVASKNLAVKIPAIKHAVKQDDRAAAAQLVEDLESDDSAVRLFAIQGLQRLTGQDFGYRYYSNADQRRSAVEKWRQWLEGSMMD